ncbi:hypothetical protein Slala03_53970 [Streptomyces lavendulae subsp. lavendulae]|nr:hypothetical protein Slala03_53970 [Streptomyces lavendulae subsp. lavendulae]
MPTGRTFKSRRVNDPDEELLARVRTVLSDAGSEEIATGAEGVHLGADGAVGYLLKEKVGRVADFLRAVETVAGGGVVIDPEVVRHVTRADPPRGPLARLTAREQEVLALMAEGRSNAEIAAELFLSGAAVAKHVGNAFLKLGMPSGEDNRRVKAILTWFEYN